MRRDAANAFAQQPQQQAGAAQAFAEPAVDAAKDFAQQQLMTDAANASVQQCNNHSSK